MPLIKVLEDPPMLGGFLPLCLQLYGATQHSKVDVIEEVKV